MTLLRRHLVRSPMLAAWLLAAALAMRLLVPAGFMPAISATSITITLCSGEGPMQMVMPMPATGKSDQGRNQTGAEMPCPFAGLAMSGLASTDPILLDLAIAFVLLLGLQPILRRVVEEPTRLRPPPIGPPATA